MSAAQSKLPDEIAQKLTASLHKALSDDTFRASLDKVGFPPLRPKSQAEIDKFVDDRSRAVGGRDKGTQHFTGLGH